jgi:hypothetical protein
MQSVKQVKDVQQMLKDVVRSFFLLCSLNYPDMFWLPNAILRGLQFPFHKLRQFLVGISGWCGLLFTQCGHLLRNASQYVYTGMLSAAHSPHWPKTQTKNWSSLWKESVTPWRWRLEAETCRGYIIRTIKNCLQHPWVFVGHLST